ncbi:hypothetical protein, partial [Streptomyces scabiei]|uniref:hypothetical protein n=1 Tax=Streptomyces scabiei TaxID=1930 RepID=UPI0038F76849
FLANRGPDVPKDVRITVNASLIGRVVESEAEVRVGEGVYFEFPIQFQGGAGVPTVDWRVEWLSDLGTPHSDSGQWP